MPKAQNRSTFRPPFRQDGRMLSLREWNFAESMVELTPGARVATLVRD
jgi:hypothetical protein